MVRQSTRIPLVIILILLALFNILSMVNGKGHQLQHHQCHNNHESHHRCPSSKHHTGMKRKKRSDLTTINPSVLNKNHTFGIFYDNLKFDENNPAFQQQIFYEKPLNSESNQETYLEDLEKILGRFPQNINVPRVRKSFGSEKILKNKFLKNKNFPQVLSNFHEEEENDDDEEEELPNHVRVKRANSKFKQVSLPSVSSEYLQSLAESFAGPSEAEEDQDMNMKQLENGEKKRQNFGDMKKREIHDNLRKNKEKHNHHDVPYVKLIREKRYGDPDKLKPHKKIDRLKKEAINHGRNYSNGKKTHGEASNVNLSKRHAKKTGKKAIKHKHDDKKDKKMIVKRKGSSEKKNRSSGVGKNLRSGMKNKRNLRKSLSKFEKRLDRIRNKRQKSVREVNDLNESSKSSPSLEEIKNLAENLISKIDHLEESIRSHRFARNSRQVSPVNPKDAR